MKKASRSGCLAKHGLMNCCGVFAFSLGCHFFNLHLRQEQTWYLGLTEIAYFIPSSLSIRCILSASSCAQPFGISAHFYPSDRGL